MKKFLSFLVALVALATRAFADDRPNILLCVADDWGWPHAGACGDAVVKTPAFDRLVREGVLFEHAFAAAPSCTPSRNALLTGQHFYRLGEGANLRSTLDIRHPNFMRRLEEAGYGIGHWRKVWDPGDHEPGGYTQHPAGPDIAFEDFLRQRPKDQPFCFWLGTTDPHRPYTKGSGAAAGIDLQRIAVPPYLPDVPEVRGDIANYYHEVQRWDQDVARAIELLEAAGELDNTIIVMTGDNGMPFPRAKANLYDAGVRVPLAIRWGRGIVSPGRRAKEFVSLVDLAPTFLQAAGVEIPAEMTGRSLLPILHNQSDPSRTFVVTGRERHVAAQRMPSLEGYPSRAIRTEQYLLILNLEPDRWPAGVPEGATHPVGQFADCDNGPTKSYIIDHTENPENQRVHALCFARRPTEELYDLRNDPHQLTNLADDPTHRPALQQLRQQLTTYLRQTGDPRFTDQPVRFDEYPYRDDRIHRRIQAWRETTQPVQQSQPQTMPTIP